jgi:hypothetical protein
MMDGISAMDTGNNGQMLNMNVDAIGEVKILTQGYQAGVRPLERPADHRGHQERHEQVPRSAYDIQTNSDWDATAGSTEERRPEGEDQHQDARLHDRRSGRQAWRHQQAVLLLLARISAGDGGDQQAATRSAFACRPALERAGDFSQTRDNTGALFNLIKDPNSTQPCTAAEHRRLLPGGGVLGRIPPNRLYHRHRAPQSLPDAERHAAAGQNYNYEVAAPTTDNLTQQPSIRVDYQLSSKLRVTGKYSGQRARKLSRRARSRDSTTSEPVPVHHQLRRDGRTTR